ncbi:MAG: ABC transporter ATP-binding protein [Verrucomicrobiota bacterium JB022]|nr:ABC transporter ATP-binding protein [Verrucomicrobiota bacterium JB022]
MRIEDVRVTFPARGKSQPVQALKGVSLEARPGEVLGLVGESGSGKSTLARSILHLQTMDAGRIWLDDLEWSSLRGTALRRQRHRVQMVFQDPHASLNPRLTVRESLLEALRCRPGRMDAKAARREIEHWLDRVGLPADAAQRYPHEFSGGQRQRIAIARALLPQPSVVVADEPVSALDVSIQAQILNLLESLRRELGLTFVFITHDLELVGYWADRVAVMRRGEVVEQGPAENVLHAPQHPYTQELLASAADKRVR